jgi:hypothetical protein
MTACNLPRGWLITERSVGGHVRHVPPCERRLLRHQADPRPSWREATPEFTAGV